MPKTVAIKTVGCKLNQYDAEVIRGLFEEAGYVSRPFEGPADVYILNTCTVTGKSDRDCRRLARQAARRNPGATVIVTGCYAQRDPQALAALPGVSAVVGNEGKWRLPELVANGGGNIVAVGEQPVCSPRADTASAPPPLRRFASLTRAFLKIQDGCDERCAYCVVPFARGPSRSRPLPEVLAEAEQLVASGHREIVLVGVHLGAYGKDSGCPEETDLAECLRRLLPLSGLGRLRLSSLEPIEVTAQIIGLLAVEPKLCRHLHLPLQSGDDEVLRRMNRRYRAADYAAVVNEVARAVPGIAIGADVIVGFPGETDEQFRNTCEFIESLPLAYLHVFSYSPRPGTAAASMPNQVSPDAKKRRCHHLRAASESKQAAFRRELLGTHQMVVIERGSGEDESIGGDREDGVGGDLASGLTDNYVRVRVPNAPAPGSLVEVEITSVEGMAVEGHALT